MSIVNLKVIFVKKQKLHTNTQLACSRRLDSGEQVKSYVASTKKNTRGNYFFPRQFFARPLPSERLEQANAQLKAGARRSLQQKWPFSH